MSESAFAPSRAATLQSVARAAGVHASTAARALDPSQSHRISPEVVKRIREEAGRQGYQRDAIAASLRTGRSRIVGVVVPDLANPVFAPILSGISARLAREGYSMLVAEGRGSDPEQMRIVGDLIGRRVDGLILATARRKDPIVDACLAAGVATVLVNRAEDGMRVSAVITDDRGGMAIAVRHLVALGHKTIGHLAGPADLSTGALRRAGFEEAMAEAGLDPVPVVVADSYTREAGRTAARALLDHWPDLTAVAAGNDLLALGLLEELGARGIRCPAEMSVVGHNDMPLVDMIEPALTTIRIGHVAMGEEAAGLILQAIDKGAQPPTVKLVSADVVVRASTARVAVPSRSASTWAHRSPASESGKKVSDSPRRRRKGESDAT